MLKKLLVRKRSWLSTTLVVALALLAACHGFFTNPVLTSITVNSLTVAVSSSQQMTATGVFDDGSTDNITNKVTWSSSDSTIATITSSGVVTGVAPGTATMTATSGSISGTGTVTVTVSNLQSISVTPTNPAISSGQTQQFTATGNLSGGGTVDLTKSVTWNSSNTGVATIANTGVATAATVSTTSQTNITATSGNIVSNTAVLTVNP